MRAVDLVGTAVGNTFRAKSRTLLTFLAIFVGAFTLTITNGLGTGINRYIDSTLASFGSSDVLTVTKDAEDDPAGSAPGAPTASGPREYDPDAVTPTGSGAAASMGGTVVLMDADDLAELESIEGVEAADAVFSTSLDFIQAGDGTRFVTSLGTFVTGQSAQLAAGAQPDNAADDLELLLPVSQVEPLGFADADDAVGASVRIALTGGAYEQQIVEATVVGVAEETFSGLTGASAAITPNDALAAELHEVQSVGLPDDQADRFVQASVRVAADATDEEVEAVRDRLTAAGFSSTTVADLLGAVTTVIDGIVLVLNAFAIIALLAASFGIVNTLLMSVQERTREIGLMKAMGMGSGRVFALFSMEAAFIGLLGSAIGAGIAMLVGTGVSGVLSGSLLADLPGLQLIAFDPVSIALTIVAVMGVAFLAGTLPAARAAGKDPVEALRYE